MNPVRRGISRPPVRPGLVLAAVALVFCGCSDSEGPASSAPGRDAQQAEDTSGAPGNPALARIVQPWKGGLEGMIERRFIRVLTVPSPVLYFVDGGRQRGAVYEIVRRFEDHLNKELANRHVRVHAVVLPVARDELIPRLVAGQGDLAIAQLTITPERKELVDFSIPVRSDVSEVLVTGPAAPPVETRDDLAGKTVYVRASSSYAEHLEDLNRAFRARDMEPVDIVHADELLEAGDILEMVQAGLVPATVVDSPLAELYVQVFPHLSVREDIVINTGGRIAWAFRKGSPELAKMVNGFVRANREGTLVGNVLINRYLKETRWVENARDAEGQARFRKMVGLFKKYGERYGLDPLLLLAQGYQESKLRQSRRSPAGAVGVMQMLPSTARDPNVGIPDITDLENNIQAGAKYLRWMMDRYYDDPDMRLIDRELFALASYNAGPARVARLRREARDQGLDPDRWFNNVETIAAKRIGRETVQYVANIYKYYLAYQALADQEEARTKARERALGG